MSKHYSVSCFLTASDYYYSVSSMVCDAYPIPRMFCQENAYIKLEIVGSVGCAGASRVLAANDTLVTWCMDQQGPGLHINFVMPQEAALDDGWKN